MKPFILLLFVFLVSLLITKYFSGHYDCRLSGQIAMSAMLIFTAIAHFAFPKGMAMMLPAFFNYKTGIVYFTGIIEIAAAIGIFIPGISQLTGWLLVIFFLLILPANIYAAYNHINYRTGTFDGNGLSYLWFRIPLQILFVVWVFLFLIKF